MRYRAGTRLAMTSTVQASVKLVVSLKTASAVGLVIPQSFLVRANQVIK